MIPKIYYITYFKYLSSSDKPWTFLWDFADLHACHSNFKIQHECLFVFSNLSNASSCISGLSKFIYHPFWRSICHIHWCNLPQFKQYFIFLRDWPYKRGQQWQQCSEIGLRLLFLQRRFHMWMKYLEDNACLVGQLKQDWKQIDVVLRRDFPNSRENSRPSLLKCFINQLQYQILELKENSQDLELILGFLDSRVAKPECQAEKNSRLPRATSLINHRSVRKGCEKAESYRSCLSAYDFWYKYACFQDISTLFNDLKTFSCEIQHTSHSHYSDFAFVELPQESGTQGPRSNLGQTCSVFGWWQSETFRDDFPSNFLYMFWIIKILSLQHHYQFLGAFEWCPNSTWSRTPKSSKGL